MPRDNTNVEMQYDPKTGTWKKSVTTTASSNEEEKSSNNVPNSSTGKESSSKVDSKEKADKDFIESEFNTLVGELSIIPSKKNIRIKINDTVEIKGVGKNLSGNYFVSAITRSISKDGGYTQSLSVMKNGFGDSLKRPDVNSESRLVKIEKPSPEFKEGDTVRIVGKDAIYSNGSDGVKVPEWVKKKDLTIRQISTDGTRVLLMPITSWTYVKYVQKV